MMIRRLSAAFAGALCLLLAPEAAAQVELVPKGSDWRYLDDGTDPGPGWASAGFDDSAWARGDGRLGYGGGEDTTISSEDSSGQGYITSYFRTTFQVADPTAFSGLELRLLRDDGAAVYLNGQEIHRILLPAGPLSAATPALGSVSGYHQDFHFPTLLSVRDLVSGTNTIAVELHQDNAASADAAFDLGLTGLPRGAVTRSPYLQNMRPDAVVIRWRTLTPTVGGVWIGDSPQTLALSAVDQRPRVNHEIEVTGLSPSSAYFYGIGDARSSAPAIGGDASHRFHTPPEPGSKRPVRAWVLGDSGSLSHGQNRVREAFKEREVSREADLLLLLGDNAYRQGSDSEYQSAFFEAYPSILRRVPSYSTRGNHEDVPADYYQIFTMPKDGEAGGVPSGSEAYYSFDWANVHFICLDSFGSDRTASGPMWRWAKLDLANTTQDWIIAFWHHSPHSKGSRDSDVEPEMIEMRSVFLPLLEDFGVNLVLGGHSHSYERSALIQGHYGMSGTFNPATHGVDLGDGRIGGDGAYMIPSSVQASGSVYLVAGASGHLSNSNTLDHPAMVVSELELGSVILDVTGSRLDVTYLDDLGNDIDHFTFLDPDAGAAFCDAPTDGEGCVATLSAQGLPSLTSGLPFVVSADDLRSQSLGMMLYSLDTGLSTDVFNGRLCLGNSLRRTPVQSSRGTAACTGHFEFDFQPLWGSFNPTILGDTMYCQYWHRDSGFLGSTMTEGLSFTVLP